jgi:hypothetical protein
MSDMVTIGSVTTPVISYKGRRVCTTQQMAKFYGCTDKNLSDNHANNRSRFVEGKHFVKITGDELRAFRSLQPDEIGSQISTKARSLILWTDRGANRHAKMLSTDKAWDVFEQMEDSYFAVTQRRETAVQGEGRSTKFDRLPLYHFAVDTVMRHRLLFSKVYVLINTFAGTHHFKDMTKAQTAEVIDFCDRFASGQDTRNDWQRITDNQTKLHGAPPQLDMVQKLLLS